jgi:energy-coupling factor transport system substrate-specific component
MSSGFGGSVRKFIAGLIYFLSGALGVLAFIYPFFMPPAGAAQQGIAHGQDAPLLTTALVGLSVVALLVELQGRSLSAKTVAMLGVLVAVTSVLRFLEVAFPLPGGFSPIFAPIIIAGYVFGGRFGFLMGTFTLLTSGLITGGVGPWLPYQMFTAGWAGLTSGWLKYLTAPFKPGRSQHPSRGTDQNHRTRSTAGTSQLEVIILCLFGLVWGLLYGLVINVYFWPFAAGPVERTWAPGIGLRETLARYGAFYVVTSLAWDMARGVGNVALILILGMPMIKALERFRRRFHFQLRKPQRTPEGRVEMVEVDIRA